MKLYAPPEYWKLPLGEKLIICNGCGTKGLGGWIVPDTLYGLCIEEPCNVHDFMYSKGKTIEDKHEADRVFLNNMIRVINYGSGALLRALRRYRAMSYYNAVRDFGGPAYWATKNPSECFGVV